LGVTEEVTRVTQQGHPRLVDELSGLALEGFSVCDGSREVAWYVVEIQHDMAAFGAGAGVAVVFLGAWGEGVWVRHGCGGSIGAAAAAAWVMADVV
jgi:hypothetical protein